MSGHTVAPGGAAKIAFKDYKVTGMLGATVTIANAINAGWEVKGVTCRVKTLITGCTTWSIGTPLDFTAFGTGLALIVNTTTTLQDTTQASPNDYPANTNIIITAVGGGASFTAGAINVRVYYIKLVPPG